VPKLQAAGWENVVEIIGKFGGADHFSLTDSAPPITNTTFGLKNPTDDDCKCVENERVIPNPILQPKKSQNIC